MAAAVEPSPEDAADLAALLEENATLRAEHEQLLAETAECGLMLELPADPSSPQSALAVSSRLEAMKRQRKALLGVRRVADELQELSARNAKLKGEAGELREENRRLNQKNAVLRAASRASTPAEAARRPAVTAGFHVDGSLVLPPGLEKRANEISTAIKLGDQDKLNTCSDEQRKELVAAMLKVGLFDAAVPASMVPAPSPPEAQAPLTLPPAATIAAKKKVYEPDAISSPAAVRLAGSPLAHASKNIEPLSAISPSAATEPSRRKLAGNGSIEKKAQEIAEMLNSCNDAERKELVAEMLRQGLFAGSLASTSPTGTQSRREAKAQANVRAIGDTSKPTFQDTLGSTAFPDEARSKDSPYQGSITSMTPMGLPRSSTDELRRRPISTDSLQHSNSTLLVEEMDENSRERVVREKLQELNLKSTVK
mmetsp:Transcript_86032/g.200035  ORF Transcript_86032/g.200035 Transcript_86032/m.200035 type:complete len:426 (-) Transcript_86032:175-1452(-)